ncbi:MAG TPA: tripartite tricarboxylate transporter substrate binding protein, partial [Burkholderiales bacterium]
IVIQWNTEVAKALSTDEAKARMRAEGLEPGGGPPEQFQQVIKSDVEKWRRVIKQAHIKRES